MSILSMGSNVLSMKARTQLSKNGAKLADVFERLTTGYRINSASDDPAGLALASSLKADARIANIAIRNANDGLSLATIADGGLSEVGSILTRMLELATQSSNGSYSNDQRSALSSEFVALGSEIDRISRTTKFNDINLLSTSSTIVLQVGIRGDADSRISIQTVQGTLSSLGIGNASGALTYSIISTSSTLSQAAANNALSAVSGAITSLTTLRGSLGAAQSRLSSAVTSMSITRENILKAESTIRDADIAQEVAEMVRLQVIQQASTAILAQANLQPQLVLQLLK